MIGPKHAIHPLCKLAADFDCKQNNKRKKYGNKKNMAWMDDERECK